MRRLQKDRLFFSCLAASIGIHALALFFIYHYPVALSVSYESLLGKAAPSILSSKWADTVLKETFNEFAIVSRFERKAFDKEAPSLVNSYLATREPMQELPHFPLMTDLSETALEEFTFAPPIAIAIPSFEIEKAKNRPEIPVSLGKERVISAIALDAFLSKILYESGSLDPSFERSLHNAERVQSPDFSPTPSLKELQTEEAPLAFEPLETLEAELESINPHVKKNRKERFRERPLKKESVAKEPLANYSLLEKIPAAEWEGNFKVDFQLTPAKNSNDFLFSLSFSAGSDKNSSPIRQNFYFLIDKPAGKETYRYNIFKKAVLRALGAVQTGSNFNIYLIDKGVSSLNLQSLPITAPNVRRAEQFLENPGEGKAVMAVDLYSLLQTLSANLDNQQVHTLLLVSDGHKLPSLVRQRGLIKEWRSKEGAQLVIYTAAVGSENNFQLLDFLSSSNRGELLHSETNSSFPRKFSKLVKDLSKPILKDVTINASLTDPSGTLTLYPVGPFSPNLYTSRPYKIVGKIDRLSDLVITMDGRNQTHLIHMEQKIALESAKKGHLLESSLAHEKRRQGYEEYLETGLVTVLDEL